MKKTKTPDDYFDALVQWRDGILTLRAELTKTELVEQIKWGIPCYTINKKNVVALSGFKSHFGLWFYQGAFLSDPAKVLVNAQEGKTKGMRHLRFKRKEEIDLDLVRTYVAEAISNQKAGKEIKADSSKEYIKSDALLKALADDKTLQSSFGALTPGRKKAYHEYINQAKREATKLSRIEKCIPLIMDGKGPNDQYIKS